MTGDPWAEMAPDERVERVAERLFFEFSTSEPGPAAWREMAEAGRESWRVSARRVLEDVDRDR